MGEDTEVRIENVEGVWEIEGIDLGQIHKEEVELKSHRLAIMVMSPTMLDLFAKAGEVHIEVKSHLPEDAEFVGAWFDPLSTTFNCMYRSEEFQEMQEGMVLPHIRHPSITRVDCPLVGFSIEDGDNGATKEKEESKA